MRPLKSIRDIRLITAWNRTDAELQTRVKEFWTQQQAIELPAERDRRAHQLVMVAADGEGNILATSTALKTKIDRLNHNWLYEYRCFIAPQYRTLGFDCHLTVSSLEVLETQARLDPDRPIGVFVLVQNKRLNSNKFNNATVWRAYNMILMGYNADGFPIRVCYFKGATV